jgi:hypothetical protein
MVKYITILNVVYMIVSYVGIVMGFDSRQAKEVFLYSTAALRPPKPPIQWVPSWG